MYLLCRMRSQDSSVAIATGSRWMARVRVPLVNDFSLLHSVQNYSGAHLAFYPSVLGALSPGVKWKGL
jgi:hypothetical protein